LDSPVVDNDSLFKVYRTVESGTLKSLEI
jgi:hypothetical protein